MNASYRNKLDGNAFHLETTKGIVKCRYFVNAALYSDTVAEMAATILSELTREKNMSRLIKCTVHWLTE